MTGNQSPPIGGTSMQQRKRPVHAGKALLALAVLLILLGASATLNAPAIAAAADTAQLATKGDEKLLIGRWVRPDGGYVLELKEIGKDGTLKAGYFNPRPINVARAELKRKDGRLTIFIELRDVNYPGSQYNLQYDQKADRLTGTYFQAVEKQTYTIEFLRAK